MKAILCKANELGDNLKNKFGHPCDLDNNLHEGFTIGKRGKKMYWYFIWHPKTSNASIFTATYPTERSYIKGDQLITVHFKD